MDAKGRGKPVLSLPWHDDFLSGKTTWKKSLLPIEKATWSSFPTGKSRHLPIPDKHRCGLYAPASCPRYRDKTGDFSSGYPLSGKAGRSSSRIQMGSCWSFLREIWKREWLIGHHKQSDVAGSRECVWLNLCKNSCRFSTQFKYMTWKTAFFIFYQ